MYVVRARRHITPLRRARLATIIEIESYPAHEGLAGNAEADEWRNLSAEEPDGPEVELLKGAA
jgi:hypothetical protein